MRTSKAAAYVALLALLVANSGAKQNLKPAAEYFSICSYSDPKLNECIKSTVQSLRPKLVAGMKELNLPILDPLFIQEMVLEEGSGNFKFKQVLTNVTIYGLGQYTVQEVKSDLSKYYMEIDMKTPDLRFEGEYEMEGKILRLPISGRGRCTYDFTGVRTGASVQGEVVSRGGEEYFLVKDLKWTIDVDKARSNFTNLFNGDKNLGDATNSFLNENWREAFVTAKHLAEDAFGILFKDLANRVYGAFPAKELFRGWPGRQAS